MKDKTKNLSEKEKAYVIFLWITHNIDYDTEGFFSGNLGDCAPETVFRKGKGVCSGYANLFKSIADNLGLNVECVTCYCKGYGYEPGQQFTKTDHEYNVININNKWYNIDSTWGAGHLKGNQFIREYNEFYFFVDPELLIKTHYPADPKWLMTNKKYTLEEFSRWPKVYSNFHKFGFKQYSPLDGFIHLPNTNEQKFVVWRDNMKNARANCNVYLLEGNTYMQQLNCMSMNYYNDRVEFDCIFNKRGKYKIELFGNNNNNENITHSMMDYIVQVDNDARMEKSFPKSYALKSNLNIIEPLYDNLRSGQNVNFKFMSDLNEIIIIDNGEWIYLNKNENGLFEKDICIRGPPGSQVIIGMKNGEGGCSYIATYKVV